jgi:uncharacterized protein YjbJ (UPF0337 family)
MFGRSRAAQRWGHRSNGWNEDSKTNEKGRKTMKPSTQDQVTGTINELKGKAKEKVGQVTNNPNLKAEGQAQQVLGKLQKKAGQIEKVIEK